MNNIPEVQFGCVANVFVKMMHFTKAGDCEKGHQHVYDHMSLLSKGSVKITVDEKETTFTAPALIFVHAEKRHEIVALEDDTVWACIHALRKNDGTGEIVSPDMLPAGVDTNHLLNNLASQGIVETPVKEKLTEEEEEYLHARENRGMMRENIKIIDPLN
jgi:hypothetical protein